MFIQLTWVLYDCACVCVCARMRAWEYVRQNVQAEHRMNSESHRTSYAHETLRLTSRPEKAKNNKQMLPSSMSVLTEPATERYNFPLHWSAYEIPRHPASRDDILQSPSWLSSVSQELPTLFTALPDEVVTFVMQRQINKFTVKCIHYLAVALLATNAAK